jgi:hypothetical protein
MRVGTDVLDKRDGFSWKQGIVCAHDWLAGVSWF